MDMCMGTFAANKVVSPNLAVDDFSKIPRPLYVFVYMLKGEAEYNTEGTSIRAGAGDIVFIPLGAKYKACWYGVPESICISCYFAITPNTKLFSNKEYMIQKLEGLEHLKDTFLLLSDKNYTEEYPLEATSRFYRVCHELFDKLDYKEKVPVDKRVARAINYLEENCTKKIPVSYLAQISNMSESRFFGAFKEATGKTPIEYKNGILIKRAAKMLVEEDDKSIEEISYMLGFESSAHFRRLFKVLTDYTPREYRSRMRNGV